MEINAKPALRFGVALKIEAVAVGERGHPGHGQVRILPEDLVVVVSIAVVLKEVAAAGSAGFEREAEVAGPDRQINDVRRHARRPTPAVIHPGTVVIRIVGEDGVERAQRGRAAPEVPIEAGWRRLRHALADAIGHLVHDVEGANGGDGAEIPGADQLDHAPVVLGGMDLGANLADGVALPDCIADSKAFRQVQRHRLLQIDVLARLAGGDGDQRVPVWRSGNDNRVEVFLLQHLAEIAVAFASVFELLHHRVAAGFPGIAGAGDDHIGLTRAGAEIGAPHAAATDEAEVNAAVRAGLGQGGRLSGGGKVRRGETNGGDGGSFFEKSAAGKRAVLVHGGHSTRNGVVQQ